MQLVLIIISLFLTAFGNPPTCFNDEYGIKIGMGGFSTVVLEVHLNQQIYPFSLILMGNPLYRCIGTIRARFRAGPTTLASEFITHHNFVNLMQKQSSSDPFHSTFLQDSCHTSKRRSVLVNVLVTCLQKLLTSALSIHTCICSVTHCYNFLQILKLILTTTRPSNGSSVFLLAF